MLVDLTRLRLTNRRHPKTNLRSHPAAGGAPSQKVSSTLQNSSSLSSFTSSSATSPDVESMISVLNNWHLRSLNALRLARTIPNSSPPPSSARRFAAISSAPEIPFAVSYLINECGVRPATAAAAAKYVRFDTRKRADAVVGFFRNLGFSDSQLPKLFGRRPLLLLSDPEKQFVPRFRFFESNGFSASDIVGILCRAAEVLHASVENQLRPNLNFLRKVMISEKKVIGAVRRSPYLLTCELKTYLIPSIRILRENGVAESNIVRLLEYHPMTLMTSPDQLLESIERLKNMGMDPRLTTFGIAIQVIRGVTKETWESKVDAYKKWGWSDELILKAFVRAPWCMAVSVKKIMANMEYLVNRMGIDSLDIATRPVLLSFSLKKRMVPRDTVLSILLSKGLIGSINMIQALSVTDEEFELKYLAPYKVQAPGLLELFREKIGAC